MSGAKRESNNVKIQASTLILDIEGTTTSISFVKDVLFPYVRKHLEESIDKKWDSKEFQELIQALRIQAKEDEEKKLEGVITIPESGEKDALKKPVIDNVIWQMDNDRKTKSLKDLQGLIMEEGYKKGDLKGHVYDDVEPSLKSWAEQEKSIYIYSSGSVHAQKLLFGHSEKGDLLPFIKGHFDTTVGMKGETASYKKILEEISCSPSEAAFLTDIPKEAKAAKEAGVFSILLAREGNSPLTEEDKAECPVITSFVEIEFENSSKKRKVCTESDVKSENKPVSTCVVSVEDPKPTANGDVEMMEVEESEGDTVTEENKTEKKEETEICKEESVQNSKHDSNLPVEDKLNNTPDIKQACKENLASTCSETVVSPIPIIKDEEKKETTDKTGEGKGNESKDISKKVVDEKALPEDTNVKNKDIDIPKVKRIEEIPMEKSDKLVEKDTLLNDVDKVESSVEKSKKAEEKSTNGEKDPTEKSINGTIDGNDKTDKSSPSVEDNLKSDSASKSMSSENQLGNEITKNETIPDTSKSDGKSILSNTSEKSHIEEQPSKESVDVNKSSDQCEKPTECKTNTHVKENKCLDVDISVKKSEEKMETPLKEQSCSEQNEISLEDTKEVLDTKEVKETILEPKKDSLHEESEAKHSSDLMEVECQTKPEAKTEAKCESLSKKGLDASENKQTEEATKVEPKEKSTVPEIKGDTSSPEANTISEDNKKTTESLDIEAQKETTVLEAKCDSLSKESSISSENIKPTDESMEVESVTQETDTMPKQDVLVEKIDLKVSKISEELMETDAQDKQSVLNQTNDTEDTDMKPVEPQDIPAKQESITEPNLISLKESNKTEVTNTSQEAEGKKIAKATQVELGLLETDPLKKTENTETSKETQVEAGKIETETSKVAENNQPSEAVLGNTETHTSQKAENKQLSKEIQVDLGKIETDTSQKVENKQSAKETQVELGKIETATSKVAESNKTSKAEVDKIETNSNKIENNKLAEETQVELGKIETDTSTKEENIETAKETEVELGKIETDTSKKTENNESAKETKVDLGKIETNVPSTEKTEDKSQAEASKDQESEPKVTSQNDTLSNGICENKSVNGTTSPVLNGECNGGVTSTSLEKKCDATETKPLETIVEA